MSITRAIDSNGDWTFGHSMLNYKTDLEALKQNILTSLRSWKGDCFFDLQAGVDWINYLGSYGRDEELKTNIIKVVSEVEGVINVENYQAYLDENRKIKITFNVNTIYGTIEMGYNSDV